MHHLWRILHYFWVRQLAAVFNEKTVTVLHYISRTQPSSSDANKKMLDFTCKISATGYARSGSIIIYILYLIFWSKLFTDSFHSCNNLKIGIICRISFFGWNIDEIMWLVHTRIICLWLFIIMLCFSSVPLTTLVHWRHLSGKHANEHHSMVF